MEEALVKAPQAVRAIYHLPSFGKKKAQKRLLSLAKRAGVPIGPLQDFHAFGLPRGVVHQSVAAAVEPIWERDLSWLLSRLGEKGRPALVVILDRLEDPQNLGASIRSSAAFGADAVVIPSRRGAPVTGTVVKASAGTIFSSRICRVGNLAKALSAMKEAGLWAMALEGRAEQTIDEADLTRPIALVVGAEGRGIRKGISGLCQMAARIPIARAVESLNASVALAVALYEVNRQRAASL